MKFITEEGRLASQKLAVTRGAFPLFSESTYFGQPEVRNGTVTTIAPTGTLSIIGNCSSGVEPVFAYAYIRNIMDGTELLEVNQILKDTLTERGLYTDEIIRRIAEEGTIAHIEEIPKDIRDVYVSAHDVTPEYHIKVQAAFQKYTDNAVSKTVNFGTEATRDDVADVYIKAYEIGCKGVTIYRDGSRDGQVLNIGSVNHAKTDTPPPTAITPRERPNITSGFTEKVKIGCGNLYVTVNYDEDGICEVFTSTGKAGGCPSQSEATARLISVSLRSGISADEIISQLKGIRCPSTVRQSEMSCTSCPDGIAKIMAKVSKFQQGEINTVEAEQVTSKTVKPVKVAVPKPSHFIDTTSEKTNFCPECGETVEHEGGCVMCRNCGWGKCG